MLDLLKKDLETRQALSGPLPDLIYRIAESIPKQTIAPTMKYTIAVSEMILYASQFRRNILHWDSTPVPINSVGFVITGSGGGKDSSVNAARKCFATGYEMLNDRRKELAKHKAITAAREAGEDSPTEWAVYKEYYTAPNPLFVAPSTTEGFLQHLNDLDNDGIGSGFIYSGELGAELASSPMFIDNLKVLSELYDIGNKEVKVLKNRDNQSKEIKGLPVSALLVGSPANLLYDESVKKRFKVEFETKLARRSWFCFVPEAIPEPIYTSVSSMVATEERLEDASLAARALIAKGIETVTEYHLAKAGQPLALEDGIRELFLVYRRYNTEVANTLSNLFPMSILVRRHLQWKALKFAGAIAMFNMQDTITVEDYVQAIRFCELLDEDLMRFEMELAKEPYELFSDYIRSIAENSRSTVSLHNLRKLNYIPATGNPTKRMKELAHLAAAYDRKGLYVVTDQGIDYEGIVETEVIGISFKPIDNTNLFELIEAGASKDEISAEKQRIAFGTASGMSVEDTTFAELVDLLQGDFAYSPFKFKNGVRGKDNIVGGTKWVVLDIDDSTITAEEAHFMLSDINHHIALSSDKNNPFKFRVIIELDSNVEVNAIVWKAFYQAVAQHLALKVDPLPQSQIFYSYSGRPVLSVMDAEPLAVRDFLMIAMEKPGVKPLTERRLTTAQTTALLADELTTFATAFDPPMGAGSRELIKAAYYARDLGLDTDAIIELMNRINNYWDSPMPEDRLEKTILSQIRRW